MIPKRPSDATMVQVMKTEWNPRLINSLAVRISSATFLRRAISPAV